ncbi:MAG: CotH kinase family protein [Pseudomonadota bacterium]|nr:CotH kinase family protein [Pseudomonadota bacterium]
MHASMRMLPLLLLACTAPGGVGPGTDDPAPDTATDPDTDTGEGPDTAAPVVTEESAGGLDPDMLADALFTLDTIHEVELRIPAESEAALDASPYEWAMASVTIDGDQLRRVGVRLRGKIGSFRTLAGKPKFKISFGEFVPDQRFYGLEELSLNSAVVDCSYMKEVIGYRLYDLAGLPTLRTSYARVTVNGEPYGLYVLLETPSDKWLDRNYEQPEGNLYDGKYVWYGGGSYTLLDFAQGVDTLFQLEEGVDVGHADIAAVSNTLAANAGQPTYYAAMGDLLDWEHYHRYTAVDQFLGHNDGYSMNTNNYRVYFDPADGKADLLPWDLDYTFLYDYEWGLSWGAAQGNITAACFADAACFTRHKQVMATFLDTWDAEAWDPWLDQIETLTYAATQLDPRRECAAASVQPTRDYLRSWLGYKSAELRGWYGL